MSRIASVSLLLVTMLACQPSYAQHLKGCTKPFAKAGSLRFSPAGWKTNFCRHDVPYREIMSGGPPRDGIPPIDRPKFVSVKSASGWLKDVEPVVILKVGNDVRAYPLQVLIWHEIVNDRVGRTPVTVTFCPLCYAAIVFVRPMIKGRVLTFGTSGNLRNSDMVMWDRQTESWWQQFTGEAIVGELTGRTLAQLPATIASWREFRTQYPRGKVLSKDTGVVRRYGNNPYVGYDDIDRKPFLYRKPVDGKLLPMARVIGVKIGNAARAYQLSMLAKKGAINDRLAGTDIVLFWKKGTASAVDESSIANSRDIGTSAVYKRVVAGRSLSFRRVNGMIEDQQTKTNWNILGKATFGPLKGKQLRPIAHHNIFWFVWSAFSKTAELYRAK